MLLTTAMYCFGLTKEEFWQLTPAQFNALSKRKDEEDELADYRSGQIVAIIHNLVAKRGQAKSWTHFFPRWKRKKRRSEPLPGEEALRFRLFEAHQKRAARK